MTSTGRPLEAAAQDRARAVADAIAKRGRDLHHTERVERVELAADAMARIENLENAYAAAIEQIRHLTQALHELQHDHDALKAHTAGLAPMAHYHDFEVKDGKVTMKGAA